MRNRRKRESNSGNCYVALEGIDVSNQVKKFTPGTIVVICSIITQLLILHVDDISATIMRTHNSKTEIVVWPIATFNHWVESLNDNRVLIAIFFGDQVL